MTAPTPTPNASGPTQASRVRGFATFFKSYMSVWTLVVPALPIPVGVFKLIPSFEIQRSYLSVYTSLFCFLSLGFVFFQRHRLGHYMFRGAVKKPVSANGTTIWQAMLSMTTVLSKGFVDSLPLACILISVFAVFRYHSLFNDAVLIAQAQATAEEQKGILAGAFLTDIAAAESRDKKVALSNFVLFENKNTFVALNLFENYKISSGRLSSMSPDAMRASYSEAAGKAKRYHVFWLHGSVETEASRFLGVEVHALLDGVKFLGGYAPVPSPDEILKSKLVPLGSDLMFWYLTIFVAAETAFILMALKEYLQDLAHISDLSLMGMRASPTEKLPN
jgi:hypothetical protein